jgi:tripartite ATP-independent transporter DctP family solute receptor
LSSAWSACILAAVLATAQASPPGAREFRVADAHAPDYPTVQAVVFMGRLIEERTEGRHSLRVFHSRQLGEEKDTIEQTRVGAIDLNRTNIAPLSSFVTTMSVLALPFLFRSVKHLRAVLDGSIGEEILAGLETHGFVGLTFYDSGSRSIYTRDRAVRRLEDLKGLRLRVQQSDLMMEIVRAVGAVPVTIPYGQVETGLRTGLIDGAENNWPSYITSNHFRVARYFTVTEHTASPEVLVMSKRAWDSLSDADKTIFREAARESSRFMRLRWSALEDESRRLALAEGNVIIFEFPRQQFEEAMSSIYAKAARDPALARLIERIRSAH